MMQDFSELHTPTGALGSLPAQKQEWQQYRLIQNQVEAFHRDGFLAGVQVLDDHQVETLCTELAVLVGPSHPSHALFHAYHSNESSNPDRILFRALGTWRTGLAFHDVRILARNHAELRWGFKESQSLRHRSFQIIENG
jgi:hypothetical protein